MLIGFDCNCSVCFCVGWWSILAAIQRPKPTHFNPLRLDAARRSTSTQTAPAALGEDFAFVFFVRFVDDIF